MAILDPSEIPADRRHLDEVERLDLLRLEMLVAQSKYWEAQEAAEDLWRGSKDAHRELFHGLSNALTAACARESGQDRGARQILDRTVRILAPYPRKVLGMDLDALLESLHAFVQRGDGDLHLIRQG